ncbi:hypothetical protein V1264_000521 [Littorina saxatilis]
MSMPARKGLTWSTWSFLRQRLCAQGLGPLSRSLFSKTGVWEQKLTKKEHDEIESHWMPIIRENDKQRSMKMDNSKDKFYVLSMFPYPSGKLHMGHVRVYTLSDTMARFQRLLGRNVIHPMGWDAFGLPAENAAIERGEKPDQWTYKNIESMRQQLEQLGCSFDWHREYATCDPSYYRWTQYLFLKMLEAGLVYQREGEVNWDPVDQTVLADEQVDEAGRSWRSGAIAEKRFLKQWYIKVSAYAKSLYDGLSEVDETLWRDIIAMQRHWIGECDGTRLHFSLQCEDGHEHEPLSIYTSTPEAVYGVAFIAISPQNRLNQTQLYQENFSPDDADIPLSAKAVHPFTGKPVPIVVSASMEFDAFNDVQLGIPSVHDSARKVADRLGIEYTNVLKGSEGEEKLVHSQDISGLTRSEAFDAVLRKAKELGVGGNLLSRRSRDWLVSRQRYWGTPIPMIHCEKCLAVPVPYDQLPVELPSIDNFTGRGPSPLAQQHDWINTTCPKCGGAAKRETDTMDTFVDSSWYFLRYLDPSNTTVPCSKEMADKFMPVDLYIGGKEHAVMHLYYARFFCHFLFDEGLLKQREPFVNLLTQGMVMGQSFRVKDTGRYLSPDQVDLSGPKPKEKSTGAPVAVRWEKMSKSKYNGVDPQEMLGEFGVDATRLCILSSVSPQANRKWSSDAYKGILRWQGRIWQLIGNFVKSTKSPKGDKYDAALLADWENKLFEARNSALRKVTFHCSSSFLLNTAVAFLQLYSTTLGKVPPPILQESMAYRRCLADLCIMLGPMAPCFASELWTALASVCKADLQLSYHWERSVLDQEWPVLDAEYELPLILKINNYENGVIGVKREAFHSLTPDLAHDLVRTDPSYQQRCQGQNLKNIDFSVLPDFEAVINFTTEKQTQA